MDDLPKAKHRLLPWPKKADVVKYQRYRIQPCRPYDEDSTPVMENEPGKESVIHRFTVPPHCYFVADSLDQYHHAGFIQDPEKFVPGKVRVLVRKPFKRPKGEEELAVFDVGRDTETARWLTLYLIEPGDVVETLFTADKVIDIGFGHSTVAHSMDVYQVEYEVDLVPEDFMVIPEVPNREVSRQLLPNVKGFTSVIHDFRVPTGFKADIPSGYGLHFIPRDSNGQVITGTVEVFTTDRLDMLRERIMMFRGAAFVDWTHARVPSISPEKRIGAGEHIITHFTSDKVLDPEKTFFQIKIRAIREKWREAYDERPTKEVERLER